MCCRRLGAAAASILSQNLEMQGFFREVEMTESEKDNERYDRPREREREKDKQRYWEREWERYIERADNKNHGQRRDAQLVLNIEVTSLKEKSFKEVF